jgi:hypothetical protein
MVDAHGRASRKQQIREADQAIERANADLDDTIRQLGGLGLLGRPASQQTLEKLTAALDDAHSARARLGDQGESDVIGPDEIDKLREPAKRLAAWRRLITDIVQSVTVAPAMTADGRPSRVWDPRRIDIRFRGQHPWGSRQQRLLALPSTHPAVVRLAHSANRRRFRRRRPTQLPRQREATKRHRRLLVSRDSSLPAATLGSLRVAASPREWQLGVLASHRATGLPASTSAALAHAQSRARCELTGDRASRRHAASRDWRNGGEPVDGWMPCFCLVAELASGPQRLRGPADGAGCSCRLCASGGESPRGATGVETMIEVTVCP